MNKPELLAPAGSFEALEAAIKHGADAVYIGIGPFNLRAFSPNFSIGEISEVMKYAKAESKKIYAVLNLMPSDDQMEELSKFLKELSKQQDLPHAFIVSDPGVLMLVKEIMGENTELHLSTQTGTFNKRDMSFWRAQGVSRVVLPREMTLEQIEDCSKSGICETEIFIHGAMCMSISGRCLLGAYISDRHPNHGVCPQPCRYEYKISPKEKNGSFSDEEFLVEENENGTYFMNSKDLNTINILPEIIKTGTHSLKIEGRNKSAHYVSAVVRAYRAAIDDFFDSPDSFNADKYSEELSLVDHREYTTGFYDNEKVLQDHITSKATSKIRVVGVVKALLTGGEPVIDVKNPFTANEELNILPVSSKKESLNIKFVSLSDLNGNTLDRAITNRIITGKLNYKLSVGDVLRRII